MASSSSSSGPSTTLGYYLYNSTKGRVAYVGITQPAPPVVVYNGTYYVWSDVNLFYQETTPLVVTTTGQAQASVASNPIF